MFKKYFEGKKAVFFDLDGTIVKKTEDLKIQALQKTLNDNGAWYINASEYSFPGYPFEESWRAIRDLSRLPEKKSIKEWVDLTIKNYLEIIKNTEMEETEGFWIFADELKNERGIKLALVTNSYKDVTEAVLEKIGASGLFDVMVCGDEVKRLKPDPEMLKKAAKMLRVKNREVLVFEDSVPGSEASKKAGMDTIIIWNGVTPKYNYEGKILDFLEDFSILHGKLDETEFEYVTRQLKEASEETRAAKETSKKPKEVD